MMSSNSLGLSAEAEKNKKQPPMSKKEIQSILLAFGLTLKERIDWESERPFSSGAILITNERGKIFIKRHNIKLRSPERLNSEHQLIYHLLKKGCRTPYPLKTNNGHSTYHNNQYIYEVFSALNYNDTYADTPSWMPCKTINHAYSLGALLSQFHNDINDYHLSYNSITSPDLLISGCQTLLNDDIEKSLEKWIYNKPEVSQMLKFLSIKDWKHDLIPLVKKYHNALLPHLSSISPLWGHGDWHSSNLSWHKGIATEIFDFSLSSLTTASFDIAVAIERNFISWLTIKPHNNIQWAQIKSFMQGYVKKTPLSSIDYKLIGLFLPLVHLEFAFSEAAYYAIFLNDISAAHCAWHHYLIDHLKWFSTQEGKQLINYFNHE